MDAVEDVLARPQRNIAQPPVTTPQTVPRVAGEERMQKNEHARLIDGNHNAATMDEPASGSTPLLVSIAQEKIINL